MRKKLKWSKKNTEYINNLQKIYLVARWAKYGVMELSFSGKFKKDKETGELHPLVYYYYDGNGTCSLYLLEDIFYVTSGNSLVWTFDKNIANYLANALNNLEEK